MMLQVIPVDKTGNFDMMYSFLKENWKIGKWVALGAVIFEVKMKQLSSPWIVGYHVIKALRRRSTSAYVLILFYYQHRLHSLNSLLHYSGNHPVKYNNDVSGRGIRK